MHDLISIGRFAQITRLTIKALHIYELMRAPFWRYARRSA
jgi:hypothetical protein